MEIAVIINYASHVSTKTTSQDEPIPGKPMIPNSAGGFTFDVGAWARLDRWLILGSEAGTYYVSERKLTQDNAKAISECANLDAKRTVDRIVEISVKGRAPKNDQAIFALALIASTGSPAARALSLQAMPAVCRIGTHLFAWVAAIMELRGWSKAVSRAVKAWHSGKAKDGFDRLAYDMAKYQQRNGISHRDVLRLSHVPSNTPLFRWCVNDGDMSARVVKRYSVKAGVKTLLRTDNYPSVSSLELPGIIQAFEEAKKATDKAVICRLIRDKGLTREMIPTSFLNEASVWDALLEKMPITAMIRNLGKMTSVGLISPLSEGTNSVVTKLTNGDYLKRGRVHPLNVLVAMKTYCNGRGDKGSLMWRPETAVVNALDRAFYATFGNVPSTGKRWLLALDISGSMSAQIAGMPISCREACAAMSLVTAATEPMHHIVGFTAKGWGGGASMHTGYLSCLSPLTISPRQRMDDAMHELSRHPMGGTDCALPMLYAAEKKIPVDVFVTYTDSETWHGAVHPTQALKQYRNKMGIETKNIVVGMTATNFTINDPSDPLGLDVCGFDTATPSVMANFVGVPEASTFDEAEGD